jgi:beta-glucanase (GH16 family)
MKRPIAMGRLIGISILMFGMGPSACALAGQPNPGFIMPRGVPSNGLARSTVGEILDLSGYTLTFNDDFDKLDVVPDGGTGIWFGPIHKSFGTASFVPPSKDGPFFVEDGILTIRASVVGGKWQSGLMQSMDSHGRGFAQTYGYFEMRAKLPAGHATWPAFWLLTANGLLEKNVTRGEIDVVEAYGDQPGVLHSSVHVWPPDAKHWYLSDRSAASGMSDGFHRYGVMITPQWVTFYYDGLQSFRFPTLDIYKVPVYMVVDLAMTPQTLNQADNPSDLQIDYVRAYAAKP